MKRESFSPASVIMYLVPYYGGESENISRYAAARDYHIAISEINSRLCELILAEFPSASVRGYGDHSPIDERDGALSLSLGILGDNGLLINEKYGSYVFIADVVTDIPPDVLGAKAPAPHGRCEGCGACRSACPTGCLSSAADCLSAITQRKGELTDEEKRLMRKFNTVWGCDECQRVCPHNREPILSPLSFFRTDRIDRLTEDVLASLSKDELRARAFGWRGRGVLVRNLEVFSKGEDS